MFDTCIGLSCGDFSFFSTIFCIFQKSPVVIRFLFRYEVGDGPIGGPAAQPGRHSTLSVMHPETDEPYRRTFDSALRILSRRDHSIVELRRKLEKKGFPEEEIRRVVAEGLRLGYLDDERAAHALINRLKNKGCGIRRIRFELRQRGLSGGPFIALLQSRFSPEEELGLARRVLERKLKTCSATAGEPAKRARLYRFLLGRGFSELTIRAAINELGGVERQDSSGHAP